jgi:hypothetical protein
MTELKNIASLLVGIFIIVFISMRAMNAMLVHDNALIVLAPRICPVALDGKAQCVINGSLSHNFIYGEVEIKLPDKSQLVVQRNDVLGYSTDNNSTHFEPFGKYGSILIGLLIIVGGFCFAILLPAYISRPNKR